MERPGSKFWQVADSYLTEPLVDYPGGSGEKKPTGVELRSARNSLINQQCINPSRPSRQGQHHAKAQTGEVRVILEKPGQRAALAQKEVRYRLLTGTVRAKRGNYYS